MVSTFLGSFLAGSLTYPGGYCQLRSPRHWLAQCDILHKRVRVTPPLCAPLMGWQTGADMWDRSGKSTREARDFAAQHALTFHADAPGLPSAFDSHPFSLVRRDQCVSGQWRGRTVQRFLVEGTTVELMALPRPLPRLQVVPAGGKRGAMEVGGLPVVTGDDVFDRSFTVYADDADYVKTLVDPQVREALLHPAFSGRSLTIDADIMYLWTLAPSSWDEARVRFEFLSVLIARIPLAVWERFDRSGRALAAPHTAAWMPEAVEPEVDQWAYAPIAAPVRAVQQAIAEPADESPITSSGDGMFLPGPESPDEEFLDFAVAPLLPN